MDVCKIGSVGKSIRCPEYSNGECMNINHCIYKDKKDIEKYGFTRYVIKDITNINGFRYMNDGYHCEIHEADFFLTKESAERELDNYINQEDFVIKEVKMTFEVS